MKSLKGYVFLAVPEDAWELLTETLIADSESSAFEKSLRQEISAALCKVKDVTDWVVSGERGTRALEEELADDE